MLQQEDDLIDLETVNDEIISTKKQFEVKEEQIEHQEVNKNDSQLKTETVEQENFKETGLIPASPPFTKISSIKMYKRTVVGEKETAKGSPLKRGRESGSTAKSFLPRIIKRTKE